MEFLKFRLVIRGQKFHRLATFPAVPHMDERVKVGDSIFEVRGVIYESDNPEIILDVSEMQ